MHITPGMTNAALADALENINMLEDLYEPVAGATRMEHDSYAMRCAERQVEQTVIDEAIARLRERGDEE